MFTKILLAYDGSAESEVALAQALAFAREAAVPLHIVSVAWSAEVETQVALQRIHADLMVSLEALRDRLRAEGTEVKIEVLDGQTVERIVDAADRLGADVLVMGHRHRCLLSRMAEGSVAKRVIDRAHCSVVVTA